MAKFTTTIMSAIAGISALIASEGRAEYSLGANTTFHTSPALQPTPTYTAPVPRYTPAPTLPTPHVDLRPPSIVNPPRPDPNVVRSLPPLPPAPAPAPKRFEGGGIVVPTPTGGAAGSGVLRDNKNGTTLDVHGRTEPGGYNSVTGGVTKDIP